MKAKILLGILWMILGFVTFQNTSAQQGGFDLSNFDPAAIQKRIMDGYRAQLEIANDDEWKIIEGRIQKLLDARRAATPRPGGMGGMGGMAGMARMLGGGAPREGAGGEQQQRASALINQFLPPASPEEDALKKALDAKAPKDEIKAALAKVNEARKEKQAALDKARADLREVLTIQQEAIATLGGLL